MPAPQRSRLPIGPTVGLVVMLALATLLPPSTSRAEVRSLFGPSPAFANLNNAPVTTPDGRFVLFSADLERDGVFDLYRAPLAGGSPLRLSDPVTAGAGILRFALSPDGARVVYISSQEVEFRAELYSVPLEAGRPVKLNGPLPAGGNVDSFRIDPAAALVVYRADQQTNEVTELYKVPISGGAPVKLNRPLVSGGDVRDSFQISANGQFAVYRADQEVNDRDELYSVALRNGDVQKLNGPLAAGGIVSSFDLSPLLNIAVYLANESGAVELYSVQLNGNPIGKLNGALPAGTRVTTGALTRDGQRVVYNVGKSLGSAGQNVIYSASIFGGPSVSLSPFPSAGENAQVTALSPDGRSVVIGFFKDDGKLGTTTSFFAADVVSGARTNLFIPGEDEVAGTMAISPDSGWLVYVQKDLGASFSSVFAIPMGGGQPAIVSLGAGDASFLTISPGSDRVLFLGRLPLTPACPEANLFTGQIFGGGVRRLTDLCLTGDDLGGAQWIADSGSLLIELIHRDQEGNDAGFELIVSDGLPLEKPAEQQYRLLLPLVRR